MSVVCTICGKKCGQFHIKLDREAGKKVKIPLIFCLGCTYKANHGEKLTFVNPNNGHEMSIG